MAQMKEFCAKLRVGARQTYGNMALYCLLSEHEAPVRFLTLDNALANDALAISELTEGGSVRDVKSCQQVRPERASYGWGRTRRRQAESGLKYDDTDWAQIGNRKLEPSERTELHFRSGDRVGRDREKISTDVSIPFSNHGHGGHTRGHRRITPVQPRGCGKNAKTKDWPVCCYIYWVMEFTLNMMAWRKNPKIVSILPAHRHKLWEEANEIGEACGPARREPSTDGGVAHSSLGKICLVVH
ncbi:MAG: hypothetical protein M1511_05335 [Deltaproteobacteria bacterium]|nr:hypothetical protein [Deltaproteobacteria bacterium]